MLWLVVACGMWLMNHPVFFFWYHRLILALEAEGSAAARLSAPVGSCLDEEDSVGRCCCGGPCYTWAAVSAAGAGGRAGGFRRPRGGREQRTGDGRGHG